MNTIYPVGSIYISTNSTNPMATLISGSTWELVSSGKALWTGNGSNANTTISAGLPDITGYLQGLFCKTGFDASSTSALYYNEKGTDLPATSDRSGYKGIHFSASRSNSIYGSSTTVQPPAYVVNVWRRTA